MIGKVEGINFKAILFGSVELKFFSQHCALSMAGLKNILIPYRRHLVKLQYGQPLIDFGWLRNVRRRNWNFQKT